MAEIRDIAVGSSYTGNAALGGGDIGVLNVDNRPIQQLAAYSLAYNKAVWEEDAKDKLMKAAQLAEITAYDLGTAIPKDRQIIQKDWNEFYSWVQKNPNVLDYKNNPNGFLEYNRRKAEFKNNLSGAKVRNVQYQAKQQEIANTPNASLKELMKREMEQEVSATDVRTPLTPTQKFDMSMPEMPKPTSIKFDVYRTGANENFDREHEMLNMRDAREKANVYAILGSENIDPNTPEGKRKLIARQSNIFVSAADHLNAAISSYKRPDGTVDEAKIKGTAKEVIELAKKANSYLAMKREEIRSGAFKDQFGRPVNFGSSALREEDYAPINWEDGVSPDEIALMNTIAEWKGDTYSTKTVVTNNQIEQQRLAQDAEELKLKWANFGLEKKKLDKADDSDLLAADGVIREMADIINSGDNPANKTVFADKYGNRREGFKISDPTILQKFGNIDKDGKTSNIPDEARYIPATNQIDLVYYKKDVSRTSTKVAGEEDQPSSTTVREDVRRIRNSTGGYQVSDIKSLNARTWGNMVSQRTFAGKERGAVNEIVQGLITKNNGDLYSLAKKYRQGGSQENINDNYEDIRVIKGVTYGINKKTGKPERIN